MTEPTDHAIEVSSLVKKFGARTVLDGLSFTIPRGQVVALVGPSGGGKSTLIRCMSGLNEFDGGSVTVDGVRLSPGGANATALSSLRQHVGFVFQQWHLFPHMTSLQNVMEAPVHVKHVPLAVAKDEALELLAKVGLSHRIDAMPRNLSGGEQQRCAIARALAMKPAVLFMDEPTSALDPRSIGSLIELLESLTKERSLTLVVVTHEMSFARELAQRALVLHEGHVIEDGPPNDVLVNPKDPRTRSLLGTDR